jgi:hypothetical protein
MNLGSPGPLSGRIGVNGLQADFRINSPGGLSSLDRTRPGALRPVQKQRRVAETKSHPPEYIVFG